MATVKAPALPSTCCSTQQVVGLREWSWPRLAASWWSWTTWVAASTCRWSWVAAQLRDRFPRAKMALGGSEGHGVASTISVALATVLGDLRLVAQRVDRRGWSPTPLDVSVFVFELSSFRL
ncbi:hypothetical protein Dimus_036172 [Dionaea muscipula]